MAFTVISAARLPLLPPSRAGPLTTLQASLDAADRPVAPPHRAFDTGLRPGPFPDRAASLLPGLLAATRAGLTPASDNEHDQRDHLHTVTPLFRRAHERPRLAALRLSKASRRARNGNVLKGRLLVPARGLEDVINVLARQRSRIHPQLSEQFLKHHLDTLHVWHDTR